MVCDTKIMLLGLVLNAICLNVTAALVAMFSKNRKKNKLLKLATQTSKVRESEGANSSAWTDNGGNCDHVG